MNDHRTVGITELSSAACKREIVIIGAGGFGAVAASVADDINTAAERDNLAAPWDVIGYADRDASKRGTQHAGRAIHGTIEELGRDFCRRELWFFCAIGDNGARAKMVRLAQEFGWQPATLVHPSAVLHHTVEIGVGTYVGPGAVIFVNAKIGNYVLVDAQVSIGHDAVLADFCDIFPGARVNGFCRLGEYSVVGSNAALLPGTIVGDRAVVGACSFARGTVPPDTTVIGVPAGIIHRRSNQ